MAVVEAHWATDKPLASLVATHQGHGATPLLPLLGDSIEGESRDIAYMHAAIARQIATHGEPAQRPCVMLSVGETTVTVHGQCRGGHAAEFLLALASML